MTNFCPLTHLENENKMLEASRTWADGSTDHGVELITEACPNDCPGPRRLPLEVLGVKIPCITDGFECPDPSKRSTAPGELEII